jgi:Skp family chaperone for outer membrane proteins
MRSRLHPRYEGVYVLVLIMSLLLAFGALAACGAAANERAVKATRAAVSTLRVGFHAYDDQKQDEIIEKAKTFDEGFIALQAHWKQRDKIIALFETFLEAVMAAYEADFDEKSAREVARLAAELHKQLNAFQKKGQ